MEVKKGDLLISRKSGYDKFVVGFTTKPDGIRRARLQDVSTGRETRTKVDSISKNYALA